MTKKILIIDNGSPDFQVSAALLKETYGKDISLFTLKEAKENNMKMENFDNVPPTKAIAPIPFDLPVLAYVDYPGRYNRRMRRKEERKKHKKQS